MSSMGRVKQFASPLVIGLMLCFTLLMSACGGTTSFGGQTNTSEGHATVKINVSWTRLYHDLSSLKQSSDIAVDGIVVRIASQTVEQAIPSTDFTFSVDSTLFDPNHLLASSSIIVHQTGGAITTHSNGKAVVETIEVQDDPLFHVGDHLILFLHEYAPNHYFVVGGPSGRFVVSNGLVQPINGEGVSLPQAPTESEFASQVKAA